MYSTSMLSSAIEVHFFFYLKSIRDTLRARAYQIIVITNIDFMIIKFILIYL